MSEAFDVKDWGVLFPGDDWTKLYTGTHSTVDGEQVEDVTPERIARVDASYVEDGLCRETDLALLVQLTDGSWATCMAWCDTTGWDCRAGVEWKWSPTRDDAIRMGLDRAGRNKLGVSIPEDAEGAVTS